MSENILEINNLSKYFGGLAAVSNCSLKVKKGTITGIIGPNGSGKTTLFNLIAGNLKSSSGSVIFDQENITDVPSYELFSKGLLRTFQIAHEFSNLSVLENLMMVPGNQSGEKLMTALLKPKLVAAEEVIVKEKDFDVEGLLEGIAGMLEPYTEEIKELKEELSVLTSGFNEVADEPAAKKVANTFSQEAQNRATTAEARFERLVSLRNSKK